MHTTPHTKETLAKMSAANKAGSYGIKKGEHRSSATEFKKGMPAPMKGRKRPDLVGNTNGFKKGRTPWNKGKKMSPEHCQKLREAHKGKYAGELASNWKGGITPANKVARTSSEYRQWQSAVFARDNYTCQMCDSYGEYLHADHIKPFAHHPELRYDVENGRSLCRACHYYITFKRKMPSTSKWGLKKKTG